MAEVGEEGRGKQVGGQKAFCELIGDAAAETPTGKLRRGNERGVYFPPPIGHLPPEKGREEEWNVKEERKKRPARRRMGDNKNPSTQK